MGTKRPSCTLFDTLSNINTSDRKLQLGGKISRDPSPRPAMTAQSERERDSNREEDRRTDKSRYKDMDPRDRYYERDRAPAPRPREGERKWRERERRQEDDRNRNGRLLSNLEKLTMREVERGMEKGGTFPRMRKNSADCGKGMASTTEMEEERGARRQRDRQKRVETDDWEQERERVRQRERRRERERDEIRSRTKEEGKNTGGRPVEDEKSRKRDRYEESGFGFQDRRREVGDSWDRRERDTDRKREKPKSNMREREARLPSPHRTRDREIYPDWKEREKAPRREGRRDTRSEGDSDERELKRERVRYKERQELTYQHSRSEGDSTGKPLRERDQDRQGHGEEDRQKYREVDRSRRKGDEKDRERYREFDRRAAREGDRWKESVRDLRDDRREEDRYREHEQRRGREREADLRWDDKTGRSSRSQSETAPRMQPRAPSSGECSSNMDNEMRSRRARDSYEESQSGRENTAESDRDVQEQRNSAAESSHREQKRDRGEKTEKPRRMWLEPQRGKNSKDEFVNRERHTRGKERREEERSMESQAEWEREGRRVKEEPDEKYLDQSSYRGRHKGGTQQRGDIERETEGVSVDGEEVGEVWREEDKRGKEHLSDSDGWIDGSWRRDAEGENVTDKTEESDREEEGGSDYWARSGSEGGSDTGWRQERDTMLSGEDGFVTVSSGGDEEDEKEEDEEEQFVDCQEFLEGGVTYDGLSPVSVKGCEGEKEREEECAMGKEEAVHEEEDDGGREKQPTYIFCVIGQTFPRSITSRMSQSQVDDTGGVERQNPNIESRHCSDEATQQPHDDLHPTQRINDEPPIIYNQDTESKSECDVPRPATGETTEVHMRYRASSELHGETGEGVRSEVEHPYAEIGPIKRDMRTEKLLVEWREKNKEEVEVEREQSSPVPSNPYGDVCPQVNFEQIQPILEGINTRAMSPEEVEAIRIRLSGAWSMSEEPKRHSQAPHLKWAKNVVQEILGHSEEHTVDEPNAEVRGYHGVDQSETAIKNDKWQEEAAQGTGEVPVVKSRTDEQHIEPELEEEEPLEVEGLRGMGQSQADMHADQFTAVHGDTPTYTHADTLLDTEGKEDHSMDKETEPSGHTQLEKSAIEGKVSDEVKLSEIEKEARMKEEVEMYLSVSNTLYKPNSCPILNYDSESDLLTPSREGGGQELEDRMSESEEERQKDEPEERSIAEKVGKGTELESRKGEAMAESNIERGTLRSSFRDLGPEARLRRRGIRKTTERRNGELFEEEEEENAGRDRRTRIFSTTDDEDDRSKSWGEVELRNALDTIDRRKRNSRFFSEYLCSTFILS
ncbi:trichohyalin-like isoform X1 [Perca fluviatilis]|uniref:trichohyalin-like isoform X1 n=1 Tax=Perca fluviatilis TaxID=8168 RepID=UPI0019623D0F|nr:trichohyalin-like isoform X1 [Perca fluviatilis]